MISTTYNTRHSFSVSYKIHICAPSSSRDYLRCGTHIVHGMSRDLQIQKKIHNTYTKAASTLCDIKIKF